MSFMKYNFTTLNMQEAARILAYAQEPDVFRPTGKLAMPSLDSVISVSQNEVGYLTQDMPQKYILTFGLGPCIGIYTRNPVTRAQTLAHLSGNLASKTRSFGKFVRERGLVLPDKNLLENDSLIHILQSSYASDEDVQTVSATLKDFGYKNVQVLRKVPKSEEDPSIHVIYDHEGQMYDLTDARGVGDLEHLRRGAIAFSSDLHVSNENHRRLEDPIKIHRSIKF
ncbi:MAG: hypothetical protein Q8Q31_05450 [Nanoarchaeota archaeon]|nr:hypothetical protein [Nanoarchaeota archaeon]